MTYGEFGAWSLGQIRNRTETWEHTRNIAYTVARSFGGVECTEQEYMPLPYDYTTETPKETLSIEQLTSII